MLSAEEAAQVEVAEKAENRRTCLTGLYPSLCDRSLLSERDQVRADAAARAHALRVGPEEPAEPSARVPREAPAAPARRAVSGCIESSIMKPTPFLGNSGEVFTLLDGSVWEVGVGEYNYLYEYYANVRVCRGQLVIGDHKIWVTQLR